ncbi:PLP-dependent aminotransferase family protein [Lapillicoccus jejuensis]|uniref:GntR family transcriptional regulator/MocR family aminotransferase n=1 Tax=Lapillicoccus jejuensis TaxID=402171 RepID=A0A542DYC9_9MICO|nr:PLP-dependent aminotransferase family protein [Lapillicoccus jejuensis]TQJ08059.1 GntR family transcriptional regulator/MocR family aminotransferase [Lapillicoccus jejuensis]
MVFLQLDAAEAPRGGKAVWLADRLRAATADGRLPVGTALPPSRQLAAELGLSRGAVVEAYGQLAEEGLTTARAGAGTVVARRHPAPVAPAEPAPPAPVVLDLSPSRPDLDAFPRAAWLRHQREALAAASASDLAYGDPRGHLALRTALAAWLARHRGLRVSPDAVVVTAGVAQALAVTAQVLVAADRRGIAVEDPGSPNAVDLLRHWGMRPRPVPVDEQGLRVDRVEDPAVLLTPAHQFPTGVVLSGERRRRLLDRLDRDDLLVVEDDYDADQRYDRTPVVALHRSAPERVVHTGSMSKSLAPGLRLGWMVVPHRWREDVVAARRYADLGSPVIDQLTLARLLGSGDYERHLRRQRRRLALRRDTLVEELSRTLPGCTVTGVRAGVHVVVTWPEGGLDEESVRQALEERGVRVSTLGAHRWADGPPGLVLGFAANPPDRLRAAVRLIAEELPAPARRR